MGLLRTRSGEEGSLEVRLSRAGVGLFLEPPDPPTPMDLQGLAGLLVDLIREDGGRLAEAVPCLLVASARDAPLAAGMAAMTLDGAGKRRLTALYGLARDLAASRAEEVRFLCGAPRRPGPAMLPPAPPDPADTALLARASRTFDDWLRG